MLLRFGIAHDLSDIPVWGMIESRVLYLDLVPSRRHREWGTDCRMKVALNVGTLPADFTC